MIAFLARHRSSFVVPALMVLALSGCGEKEGSQTAEFPKTDGAVPPPAAAPAGGKSDAANFKGSNGMDSSSMPDTTQQ